MSLLESTFEALNAANVRYVVVGGVATVLHGYTRLTVDIDLVVDLAPAESRRAIEALTAAGFEPRIPVDAGDFTDPLVRERWQREKHMQVFPLIDPSNPLRQVDVFVESPIDFDELWDRSVLIPLEHTSVRVAAIEDLITMKRIAGRPQDREDIAALEAILDARGDERS